MRGFGVFLFLFLLARLGRRCGRRAGLVGFLSGCFGHRGCETENASLEDFGDDLAVALRMFTEARFVAL